MNPTTTINTHIATVLAEASSIKSVAKAHSFIKNNASAVEYAVFSVAVKNAIAPLYALGAAKHNNKVNKTHGAEDKIVDTAALRTAAGNAVQKILDSIGVVQGHKLEKSGLLIDDLADATVDTRGHLIGAALTAKSEVTVYTNNIKAGGNEEYLAEQQEKLDIAKATYTMLQGQPGSRDGRPDQVSDATAIKSIERQLMDILAQQYAKTPEQVAADRAEAAEKRKAQRKAAKAAKKAREEAAAAAAVTA